MFGKAAEKESMGSYELQNAQNIEKEVNTGEREGN